MDGVERTVMVAVRVVSKAIQELPLVDNGENPWIAKPQAYKEPKLVPYTPKWVRPHHLKPYND